MNPEEPEKCVSRSRWPNARIPLALTFSWSLEAAIAAFARGCRDWASFGICGSVSGRLAIASATLANDQDAEIRTEIVLLL